MDGIEASVILSDGTHVPLESDEAMEHIIGVVTGAAGRSSTVSTTQQEQQTPEDAIFDPSAYELPIPKKDGHRANVIRLSLGGSIELDLYDEDALAYLQGLRLGQELELTVTARVAAAGWSHSLKGEEQEDHAVYAVAVKAHSINIPERTR